MASPSSRPYQPSLLRLLHASSGVLVLLAWLSGLLVYSQFDGRWGRLPFQLPGEWIDLHGSIGVLLWPVALLFALYAFSMGRPQLRHPANAAVLAALLLAVGSGKLMQEDWLREGQFAQPVYGVHLLAWLAIAVAVFGHATAVVRRGGLPLVRSMLSLSVRTNDRPAHWPAQLMRSWRRGR